MKLSKRKIILLTTALFLLLTVGCVSYYTIQINSLTKLGYSKSEAKKMVSVSTIYNIVTNEKNKLNGSISKHKEELEQLGLSKAKINTIDLSNKKLVAKVNTLKESKEQRENDVTILLNNLEQQAERYSVKYEYPDKNANCYEKYTYLNNHLIKNYQNLIKNYRNYLLKNGYTKGEVSKLSGKTTYQTLNNLKKVYDKEKKQAKDNNGFASKDLKNAAMRMFRETNAYRKSKGLKPYKYNYAMQSCVFKEAKAYASNKNPHNWLCKAAANENAALASVNSDYVKIAMDFFKSDPPHEAVLSGNYNSVAIAFVVKDGMVYMIMDVFY